MKYININSHRGVVNLLSDYIVKQLSINDKIDSVIEVTNCGKFFVVNGITSSKIILDMVKVKDDFIKSYSEILTPLNITSINIIDIIIYGQEMVKKFEYVYDFYNSIRPIYPNSLIDFVKQDSPKLTYESISYTDRFEFEINYSEENTKDLDFFTYSPLTITSEFPYGYSLDMGRIEFYYSEYVCFNLSNKWFSNNIKFKYSKLLNNDSDYDIEISSDSIYPNKDIVSMVLDVFDFNMSVFKQKIESYDILSDIMDPFGNKPWLVKDKTKDLVIT